MNKPPFRSRPYFPKTQKGHNSEASITLAVNWWKSKRTLKHLAKATLVIMDHVLGDDINSATAKSKIKHARVKRARVYLDRYDNTAKNIGLWIV